VTDQRDIHVLVYGAGAVGSLLGGLLAGAGYDVTLLGRSPQIHHIRDRGLTIEFQGRQLETQPAAVSALKELSGSRFDIVLLTVRSYAVESELEHLSELLKAGGVLVSVQNGIGTDEIIGERLPDIHHIAASLTLSADISAPGAVTSSSRSGGIALAPVTAGAPTQLISGMFEIAGLHTAQLTDYRAMKWSKLLLNQMANGIPAILDWTPEQVYRDSNLFRIEQAMLRETLAVIHADSSRLVRLPGFPVPLLKWVLRLPPAIARRLLLRRVIGGRGNKLPSMLLDLHAGRSRLESDWLYGAVEDAGQRLGVPAPVNQRLNQILNGIARNQDLHTMFRDQPDRLVRNIQLATSPHHD
jgi:2-dehydropantoate 2-reductase